METEMQWLQSSLLVLVEVLVLFWLRDWNESYDWWKSFFSEYFWSHRLNLELLLEATMCTKKYGTQNLEKDERVEPNNCFYKFVVFVGKEVNFCWTFEERSVGKFTETITSKWQLRALCFLAMLQLLGLQCNLKDEEHLKAPYNLNLIGQKSYWQVYENCKTRTRTVQNKWIIINVFPVTFLLQWLSKMCWDYKKFELHRFELRRFFHKSLFRNFKETGNFIRISESSNYTELTVQATCRISFGNILLISLFLKNFHPFLNQESNFEILQRLRK